MLGQLVSQTTLNLLENHLPFNKIYTKSDWSGLVMLDCYYFDTILHINFLPVEDLTLISIQTPNSRNVEFLLFLNVPACALID